MASIPLKQAAATRPETIEERFRRLAAVWHKAVAHQSSTTLRNNHPAYQMMGLNEFLCPCHR